MVKGAWSSASDLVTPLPEGGNVAGDTYTNQYFGISYPLPGDWIQKSSGQPPSEMGRYVLTLIAPPDSYRGSDRGNVMISAQDLFFTPLPVTNARELSDFKKDHLDDVYELELKPQEMKIGGRPFSFFSYWSPATDLHWYVLSTEIRCHAVEFVAMNHDSEKLKSLLQEMNKMKLPQQASPTGGTGGGAAPVCIKDYAKGDNVIARTDPFFTEHRLNPVPVRIIIDKEGRIKHIHFISAFPDQIRAVTDALAQWRFKPYLQAGRPVEVETGIMFGRPTF